MADEVVKVCPFKSHPCLGDKCVIWVELDVKIPSPIAGALHHTTQGMCGVIAGLRTLAMISNRPPVVMAPGPGGPPVRGG